MRTSQWDFQGWRFSHVVWPAGRVISKCTLRVVRNLTLLRSVVHTRLCWMMGVATTMACLEHRVHRKYIHVCDQQVHRHVFAPPHAVRCMSRVWRVGLKWKWTSRKKAFLQRLPHDLNRRTCEHVARLLFRLALGQSSCC